MCGIAKQGVSVAAAAPPLCRREASRTQQWRTLCSPREPPSPNSVINYCRSYLCQWRQVRGKFNISLFIHLLISPRLAPSSAFAGTHGHLNLEGASQCSRFFLASHSDGGWIYSQSRRTSTKNSAQCGGRGQLGFNKEEVKVLCFLLHLIEQEIL